MCGIHGFISGTNRDLNADDFIKSGFVAGSLRGMDSSGIASIMVPKKTFSFQKLPIAGSTFIQDKYAENLIRRANDTNIITLGHTRSATVGKVGYSEAHPFWMEQDGRELIGVHNGTLTNWRSHTSAKDYDVDSDWALNQIFDYGKEAFTNFNGAYCFGWWDSNDHETLNFALNSERPMNIAFTEKGNMAFASEAGMLYWLLERHKVAMKGKILTLAAGNWYKFKVGDVENFTKEALPVAKVVTPVYHPSSYKRTTAVEEVTALLGRLAAAKEVQPTLPLLTAPQEPRTPQEMNEAAARSHIMVLHNEQQTARDLVLMNTKGTFMPTTEDEVLGITHGTFSSGDMECNGIIRRIGMDYSPDTVWVVTCIGAQDDGKSNITVVCGGPSYTVRPKPGHTLAGVHAVH